MRTWAIWALVLVGGCGTPGDAFAGRYEGTIQCAGRWEDDSSYSDGPDPIAIGFERDLAGDLYWAGSQCTIPLRVISATRAEVVRSDCQAALSDGSRVLRTTESGVLTLDGDFLFARVSAVTRWLDYVDVLTSTCDYEVWRTE